MKQLLNRIAVSLLLVSSLLGLAAEDEEGGGKRLEELMAVAKDVSRRPAERIRAVHEVAMDGSPQAMDLLMENISLYVEKEIIGGDRDRLESAPCFYELQKKHALAIPAIFRFLQRQREDGDLKLVARLLGISIVSGEMDRDERIRARDNLIGNLRIVLVHVKNN